MGLWTASVRDRRVLGNDATVRDWAASVRDGSRVLGSDRECWVWDYGLRMLGTGREC